MKKLLLLLAAVLISASAFSQEKEQKGESTIGVAASVNEMCSDSLYTNLAYDYVGFHNSVVAAMRYQKIGLACAVLSGGFCIFGAAQNSKLESSRQSNAPYIIGGFFGFAAVACTTISIFQVKDRQLYVKPNGVIYKF